jgi:hypothetical protein
LRIFHLCHLLRLGFYLLSLRERIEVRVCRAQVVSLTLLLSQREREFKNNIARKQRRLS